MFLTRMSDALCSRGFKPRLQQWGCVSPKFLKTKWICPSQIKQLTQICGHANIMASFDEEAHYGDV